MGRRRFLGRQGRHIRARGRFTSIRDQEAAGSARLPIKGNLLLEMPKHKKRGEKPTPMKGVELWKTARYNQKTGEAGGLKIIKRPIHISNVRIVEKAPPKEHGQK